MQNAVKDLLTPNKIDVDQRSSTSALVTLEPLERGFGHTLGNALRRILLSSMPGCAITQVEITGVLHEYDVIEGVLEDVIEILLNLKGVALTMGSKDKTELTLSSQGPGAVTVADIQLDNEVEVCNPDHVICHLNDDSVLEMRLTIERGRGYSPADSRVSEEDDTRAIGKLLLDATFSPINKISYAIKTKQ